MQFKTLSFLTLVFLSLSTSNLWAQDDPDEIMDDAGIPTEEETEDFEEGIEPVAPPPMDDNDKPGINGRSNSKNNNDDDGGPRPDPNYGRRPPDTEVDGEVIEGTEDEDRLKVTPRKKFSKSQTRKLCNKYRNKIISYYSKIYRVSACKRRPYLHHKSIVKLLTDGVKFTEVDGNVIAAIPEGAAMDRELVEDTARSCEDLEKSYVTYSHVDIFYVEKCKRYKFPDHATYEAHRGSRRMDPILDLSWLEFSRLAPAKMFPSVLDDLYAKLLSGGGGVDIIPVDEACEGIEGEVVTYYSRVYRIEKCYKREFLSSEVFTRTASERKKLEISSQVWLSLPNGRPIDNIPLPPKKKTALK